MDTEHKQIIKNRLNELPTKLKDFVAIESWRFTVEKIAGQFNLKEDQKTALENEVFLTLLCFEPPSDFKENIKKGLDLDENAGRRIADSINGSIFGQVMSEIKIAWAPKERSMNYESGIMQEEKKGEIESDEINFENIKKAMQPAMNAGDPMPPTNLPIDQTVPQVPKEIHDYASKSDPYREPIE